MKKINKVVIIYLIMTTIILLLALNNFNNIKKENLKTKVIVEKSIDRINKPLNEVEEYINRFINTEIKSYSMNNLKKEIFLTKKNEPYLLRIGTSNCEPCKNTNDDIIKFNKEDNHIKVYSYISDLNSSELIEIAEKIGLNKKYLISNENFNDGFLKEYDIKYSPTLFLISKDNIIKHIEIGEFNYEDLKEIINSL